MLGDKRLLFITTDTYPSIAGGGRNVFYFAKYLSQFTRSTSIIVLNYNSDQEEIEEIGDLKIKRISYFETNTLKKAIYFPRLLTQTRLSIRRNDIILFYGAYFPGFDYLALTANLLGKTTLFRSTFFGGDDLRSIRRRKPILWPIRKSIYKKFSMYFAINRKFEESWKSIYKNKIPVFRSFQGVNTRFFKIIDPNQREILRKQFDLPLDVPIILSCGYLVKRKGYLEIFQELAKLDIPFIYLILGAYQKEKHQKIPSSEQKEMQEIYHAGKKLLGDKIQYLGLVKRMERIYPLANYFLHGAIGEGTPNVLLEAMSMGIPVIMKRIDGLVGDLLVHNENAFVYDDYQEVPEALIYLMNNPIKAASIGHNGSIVIHEKYNFENVTINLFERLLKTRK